MTIPQPPNLNPTNLPHVNPIVETPNDDTDGTNGNRRKPTDELHCDCGHAKVDHEPLKRPDTGQATWQCLYCGCTRAYPATPVPSH